MSSQTVCSRDYKILHGKIKPATSAAPIILHIYSRMDLFQSHYCTNTFYDIDIRTDISSVQRRNIRQIRKMKKIGQTELACRVQLNNVYLTRETLVKIERGIQHITGAQLKEIRDCLETTYDELLKEDNS